MEPVSDKAILVYRLGPKLLLPTGQGTPNAKQALGGDNANKEQVNDSEVEVADERPPAKVPHPNDGQSPNIKEHQECVKHQHHVGQVG